MAALPDRSTPTGTAGHVRGPPLNFGQMLSGLAGLVNYSARGPAYTAHTALHYYETIHTPSPLHFNSKRNIPVWSARFSPLHQLIPHSIYSRFLLHTPPSITLYYKLNHPSLPHSAPCLPLSLRLSSTHAAQWMGWTPYMRCRWRGGAFPQPMEGA